MNGFDTPDLLMLGASARATPHMLTWLSAPTIAFEAAFSLIILPACLLLGTWTGADAIDSVS